MCAGGANRSPLVSFGESLVFRRSCRNACPDLCPHTFQLHDSSSRQLITVLCSAGVCFAESAAYICAALAGAAVVGLALQLLRAKWVSKNVATGAEPKGKRSKKRDSCAFSLVGQGKNREIVELCSGCVETNRLLRQIARDAGMEYDCYEPCTLCKDRVSRLKSLGELGSPAPRARIPFAERN
jgi:hypothetical protein